MDIYGYLWISHIIMVEKFLLFFAQASDCCTSISRVSRYVITRESLKSSFLKSRAMDDQDDQEDRSGNPLEYLQRTMDKQNKIYQEIITYMLVGGFNHLEKY